MTRIAAVSLLLLSLATSPALAGRIFGDIQMDGKPLPAGVPVQITQPLAADAKTAPVADTTLTDKAGAYKLAVKTEGKCVLTVTYDKQPVTLTVFSYKEATRYDLILERKDGKLSLRRK
jgi:hypothetical protein